jgi:16S rRNA (uracil1498-N3)-methyltransferase
MRTFFIEPSCISGNLAHIKGTEATHLSKVLRVSLGQKIELFDGTGRVHSAEIIDISKKHIKALISTTRNSVNKPPFLHIGQAVIKKKQMDLVIQKCTELGIESFQPFISGHCSPTYNPGTQEDRWQKIALEACKQCKRPAPPQINQVTDFNSLLTNSHKYEHKIILWEKEQNNNLQPFPPNAAPNSVYLLVGPEGGFTEQEICQAKSSGFKTVSLGHRILRAETAAIAATTLFQYLLGNMNASK